MNKNRSIMKGIKLFALSSALMGMVGLVNAESVFAAYNGSQQGVTVRSLKLNQVSYFPTPFAVNGVAAGPNNDLYITSGNHIYNYTVDGSLIKDMTFPDTGINYTDITVKGDRVYASYTGSQRGVTVRDLALNQLSYFATSFNISGIAAGKKNDLFLASANKLYRYSIGGTVLKTMIFPDTGVNYTDLTVTCGSVLATYSGSQRGVTVRDYDLNQISYFGTSFVAGGIVAGSNNDLYLSSGFRLYNYTVGGAQKNVMTFPDTGIIYGDLNH